MSKFKLDGILHKVFDAAISQNGFEKRIFWLQEQGGRNVWQLEAHQGMSNALDNFTQGDKVTAHIELQGREWSNGTKNTVFNTLRCWKIEHQMTGFEKAIDQAADQAIGRVNEIVK